MTATRCWLEAPTWADRLVGIVKLAWSPDPELRGFFKGTSNCLSALIAAERYDDVLALLDLAPYDVGTSERFPEVLAGSARG